MSKIALPLPKSQSAILRATQQRKPKKGLKRRTKLVLVYLAALLPLFVFLQLLLSPTRDTIFYHKVGPYPAGSILYKGELSNSLPNGTGQLFSRAGRVIAEGTFKNGKLHGTATLNRGDGIVYEGQWEEGARSGEGILYRHGVKVYEGHWSNNKLNGYGKLHTIHSSYEGNWKDNKREGYGILSRRGIKYEGEFRNDLFEGQGQLYVSESLMYDGHWQRGIPHGEGTLYDNNGNIIFSGQWQEGFMVQGYLASLGEVPQEDFEFLKAYIFQRGTAKKVTPLSYMIDTQAVLGDNLDSVLRLKDVIDSASSNQEFKEIMYRFIKLPAEPYDVEELINCIQALKYVPLDFLKDLVNRGIYCQFFTGVMDVGNGPLPDSWAGAAFRGSGRLMAVLLDAGTPVVTTLHELGHLVDYSLLNHISVTHTFESLRQAEAKTVFEFEYYHSNPEEYFAAFFANYYLHSDIEYKRFLYRSTELKEVAPLTYAFFEDRVNDYQSKNYRISINPITVDAAAQHIEIRIPGQIPAHDFYYRVIFGWRELFGINYRPEKFLGPSESGISMNILTYKYRGITTAVFCYYIYMGGNA